MGYLAASTAVMILAIALSLIYVEAKNSVLRNFFSNVVSQFWNEWELRAMVVLSLLFQYLLLYSGYKRRKYRGKGLPIVELMAWSVYLTADWMATVVLSNLLRGEATDQRNELVIWTSFILWHLGGPYNISANNVEDNELWIRRLFALFVQVGEAIYICIKFPSPITPLNFVAALIFVVGVLRYIERVWALKFASQENLRNSLTKKVTTAEQKMVRTAMVEYVTIQEYLRGRGAIPPVEFVREAHLSSIIHRPLFTHLPFRVTKVLHEDMVFTKSKSADKAFRLVGSELHFFYDLLYTKIPLNVSHHRLSLSLRTFSFFSAVSSLVAFTLINKHRIKIKKSEYPDIAVTYLLLIGAIVLEGYAFSVDCIAMAWTRIWLPIPQKWIHSRLRSIEDDKRIKTMGQLDLIEYFIELRTSKFVWVISHPFGNYWTMFRYSQWKPTDHDLKEFIYDRLNRKRGKCEKNKFNPAFISNLLDEFKGGQVFKRICEEDNLPILDDDWDDRRLDTTDFIRCVFLWHFATTLVYYDDHHSHRVGMGGKYLRIGKSLSDYMMYLVVARPLMLPVGFSEAALQDSFKEAKFFLRNIEKRICSREAQQSFISLLFRPDSDTAIVPGAHIRKEKGQDEEDYSELSNSLWFVRKLQELVMTERWDQEEKWELISEVWMEMLTYAAAYCSWKQHAEALAHGGELLTHVSLLMAHFGLNTQIRRREKAKEAETETANIFDKSFWHEIPKA